MGLAVCFFALFPTGRALAASIFSLTMSVFANEATISPRRMRARLTAAMNV